MDIEYMDEDTLVPCLEDVAFTLISELKSEQVSQRLHALNKISLIAKALGAERTRARLVPYLSGNTHIFYFLGNFLWLKFD